MSFFQEANQSYTKSTRFYINTDDGEKGTDGSKRYPIPEIRDVISIEPYGYYLPNDAIPTFVKRNGTFNGNNVFEVELYNSSTLVRKTFEIEFDERRFFPDDEVSFDPDLGTRKLGIYMENKIKQVFVRDPDFGDPDGPSEALNTPPNYFQVWLFEITDGSRKYDIELEFYGDVGVSATVLFGTGNRKSDSCAQTLGFTEQDLFFEDGDSSTGDEITFQYGKYIDVQIREARQFNPLSRIYINITADVYDPTYQDQLEYQTSNEIGTVRPRVITSDPPYRMRAITMGLFIDGKRPIPESVQCHMEIMLHSVSNEEEVPSWASADVLSL